MSPSHFLRVMQPLRASVIRSTTISSTPLQCINRSTPIIPRRLNSSTPATDSQQQEPQQERQQPTTSTAPPSLRQYPYTLKTGTVVSVGKMDRTVRVNHTNTIWDSYLRKSYPKVISYLVSDPRNSLREGDVIEFSSGYPKSRIVRHVVERIIAPFGEAIEDRPAIMTREERDALRAEKRAAKAARREQRRVESGAAPSSSGQVHGQEHIGRIRRLVLERTGTTKLEGSASA